MADIFISHSVHDHKLASTLVSFLKDAIGVPAASIFCSSLPGHDIPLTVDFNKYMKDKISNPKLVIALMTPSYMESWFCLMELGAAWSQSHKTLPIVVPPTDFSVVTKTHGLTQAWNIEDHNKLIDLRQVIIELGIKLEKRIEHDWDKKRTQWKTDSKRLINKLTPAKNVSQFEHQKLQQKYSELEKEHDILVELNAEQSNEIEEISKLKDKGELKAHRRNTKGNNLEEELNELIKPISKIKPTWMNASFFIDIIMEHYSKPNSINWYDSDIKDMVERAIQSNFRDSDAPHNVIWSGKLKPLRKALMEIDKFANEEDLSHLDCNIDPTDRDFWEEHL
ncbi:toll/interleukin-1 receptor domain-containing protein [Brucella thiophenivorans]|uniref:TIR domain protein n=1 Tax=Brucella thiophenivorans TaxID=571255 RepID=A0A256FTX2_9HYPH|nr:toll/interleukin-1 receptor domain-containing protein [Brucella thiophenivorans]OYR18273.1 TIR domain protein [Brucella thiophenivorans]